jgi:hypothetical protein
MLCMVVRIMSMYMSIWMGMGRVIGFRSEGKLVEVGAAWQ